MFPTSDVHCEDISERRRSARANAAINGIDFVEVEMTADRVSVLLHLLRPAILRSGNVVIEGLDVSAPVPLEPGERVGLRRARAGSSVDVYRITVESEVHDENYYTLWLVDADAERRTPMAGFEPLLAKATFSFGAGEPTDRDLPPTPVCPPAKLDSPEIYYLAKDYASFRQLILDRLALLMPEWRERHVPDLGITLVELLAYTGDHLSYYQDAVATEAYLDTARHRISVRRHARLVDYHLHEGCNARALLCLSAEPGDATIDLNGVYFVTDQGLTFPLQGVVSRQADLEALVYLEKPIRRADYEVFEPVWPARVKLYEAHNRIDFHTWGEKECCLPRGATRATLRDGQPLPLPEPEETGKPEGGGDRPQLQTQQPVEQPKAEEPAEERLTEMLDEGRVLRLRAGDLLIFEELVDPGTGLPEDADPRHRHAVRLTAVTPDYDLLNRQAILEIEWARADSLPFPLCLSAVGNDCEYRDGISVARGNVIVVDHGRSLDEELPPVYADSPLPECDECGEVQTPGARRYYPQLTDKPLVFREEPPARGPVRDLLNKRDPRLATPQVTLRGVDPRSGAASAWWPRDDLLSSGGDDHHFVVEMDDERLANLRFGDDELGEAPPPGTLFSADYRVGEPLAGNVGAESIRRLIVREGLFEGVAGVRNPLAAQGGVSPEKVADARLRAPHAFRQRLLRAIIPEDYARLVELGFEDQVQRAFATLGPSGAHNGRFDVNVWVDPLTGAELPPDALVDAIATYLYPFRRIGHDVTVAIGEVVLLDVSIAVTIVERAVGEEVKAAIEAALGEHGFFCPDRLTLDTAISLSQIVALVEAVPGVEAVQSLVVNNSVDGNVEVWPDATGSGDDLMRFGANQIPWLGSLSVAWT